MSGKTFSKMLSLAQLEGWEPAALPSQWSNSSSDTEFILEELGQHSDGIVSKSDARGLSEALARVARSEGATLGPDLVLAIIDFNNLFSKSGFTVTELHTGDTVIFTR